MEASCSKCNEIEVHYFNTVLIHDKAVRGIGRGIQFIWYIERSNDYEYGKKY